MCVYHTCGVHVMYVALRNTQQYNIPVQHTTTQQHYNTTTQQHNNTTTQQHNNTIMVVHVNNVVHAFVCGTPSENVT